jgi:hypothetical protein
MSEYGPHNTQIKRFRAKNLWNEILKILNLEKGIFYTIYALTFRPGETLRHFLFVDRSKLVKPFPFLLLAVTIITYLTINFIDFEGAFMTGAEMSSAGDNPEKIKVISEVGDIFLQSYNLIQLFSVPFLAFSSYLMFKSHGYHYAEHVVIAAYLTGLLSVFYIIGFPIAYWNYMIFSGIMTLVFAIYCTLVYIRVFKEPIGEGIPKGIGVQVIYYVSSFIVMFLFLVAITVYLVLKYKDQ